MPFLQNLFKNEFFIDEKEDLTRKSHLFNGIFSGFYFFYPDLRVMGDIK